MAVTRDEAQAAKATALARLAGRADVVGVGLTRVGDDYAVKVNLAAPPADADATIPATIDGVPVRVEVVGTPRKRGG